MAMSLGKTSLNAQFAAFLLWNALSHSKTLATEAVNVVVIRWKATREKYDDLLSTMGHLKLQLTNDLGSIGSSFFELIIVIFIVGALIGNVANATTGITIAHTGFTPNPNLTASPGAVPLTQLFPLVFIATGLIAAFSFYKSRSG